MDEGIEGLTKVTVNLIPKAMDSLEFAAAITGDTHTDTINRALQMYAFLVGIRHTGERVFVGRSRWRIQELVAEWFKQGDRRTTGD